MPLPTIADVYRCSVQYLLDSVETAFNVIHVRQAVPSDAQAVANEVQAQWAIAFAGDLPDSHFIVQTTALPLFGGGAAAISNSGNNVQGLQSGVPLPHQCSMVSTWRTGFAGRRNRGRSFLPFGVATQLNSVDSSLFTTAFRDAVQADADALISALDGADMPLQVASYVGAIARPVDTALVRIDVFTQRRRVN